MADYVQLALWEVEGEVFHSEPEAAPKWADVELVKIPTQVAGNWNEAATLAAEAQVEKSVYYDLASSTRGM